jgi:proteasome lid subunit RPN8/RPN11
MIIFTDKVLTEIGNELAAFEPERGGALLGLPYSNVVCSFLRDPEARTSGATYQPSAGLTESVQTYERAFGLQFFGIVHSHPGGYDQPSSQDHNAFSNSLRLNTHLSAFVAPIITLDREAASDRLNEISLSPRGRLTLYVAYRTKHQTIRHSRDDTTDLFWSTRAARRLEPVTVMATDCAIMPIAEQMASLMDALKEDMVTVSKEDGYLPVNGTVFLTETLRGNGFELILLFPPAYPVCRPSILFTDTKANIEVRTREIEVSWPFGGGDKMAMFDRLNQIVLAAVRSISIEAPAFQESIMKIGESLGTPS